MTTTAIHSFTFCCYCCDFETSDQNEYNLHTHGVKPKILGKFKYIGFKMLEEWTRDGMDCPLCQTKTQLCRLKQIKVVDMCARFSYLLAG